LWVGAFWATTGLANTRSVMARMAMRVFIVPLCSPFLTSAKFLNSVSSI
jgi:hypothetical protein